MEVLRLLGEGRSTAAIAELIHRSPKTVELHRSRIRARLGLKTANELIAFAARWLGEQQRQVPRA
jgi:DNA-binding CsgD family transcriptional regulator